jgi:hypothetical protein
MLLNKLALFSRFSCRHDFAFPRSRDNGGYSQVCKVCGAEYEYDWNAMRRKKRIERAAEKQDA